LNRVGRVAGGGSGTPGPPLPTTPIPDRYCLLDCMRRAQPEIDRCIQRYCGDLEPGAEREICINERCGDLFVEITQRCTEECDIVA
jgi:hypothetical protein